MEELSSQYPFSSSKGRLTLYKYQGFWNTPVLHEQVISAQKSYKQRPNDVLLCSCPKTGTTWLKALSFAIATREKFGENDNPLLTTLPHDCVPFLEADFERIKENYKTSEFPLLSTHLPYASLPESVISSNCKIVYIYRNVKDVIVSNYHYMLELVKVPEEDVPFEDAFNDFYEGISWFGPYWDHILGYWKARSERPDKILFLKYEDIKVDATSNVKRLAEFIGYPFSVEEEKEGVVETIIKMCSFQNMRNLQVNKSGNFRPGLPYSIEKKHFFRKAEDGDWKNYFTDEMKEKIDKLVDEKLSETGLVLK